MDKGLVMFGIFILVLGILIPIIQTINASRKENFENSINQLEHLQDLTETFWEEKKAEKKVETEAKKKTKKAEEKAKEATKKAVTVKAKAVAVENAKKGAKVANTVNKISVESIEKCKKTLNDYATQLAKEAEIANQKAQKAKIFAESISKIN